MTTTISLGRSAPPMLLAESELVRSVLANDYEVLEELGRGGMAVVFRAREKGLDREVAIKILPARLVVDQGFIERFEHEARTAAKLEHPNIVPIYRVGRAGPNGEVIYFVMKLLRGQSLSAVLRERGTLDSSDIRRILMETAAALGYAAKRSVVHRDIKPDNILLDGEGRCVVTDFGIAKTPGGQQTTAGTSLGTPRYMSPEHATGQQLDGRSDMYSLGVVAYECLVGKTPFDAEDPFAVLYKHIHEPLPQPTLASDDARQLFSIIARMLAKRPDDRFQTGNELIAALGGQTSDPSLIASALSPGLMAPTELIPSSQPAFVRWWAQLTRVERRLVVALVGVATFAAVDMKVGLLRGANSSAPVAPPAPASTKPAAAGQVSSQTAAAPIASATPAPAQPGPSPRAAAIIANNKLKSSCPKRDTLVTTKPIDYAALMDSLPDRVRSDQMEIAYDVCGLPGGSPFSAQFTLTKLHQRGIRQQPPHKETPLETAGSPRARKKWALDVHEMSAGDYRLDMLVTDGKKRQVSASREFKITDK